MKREKLTILNTSILTGYGDYRYESVTLEEAKRLVKKYHPIQSVIGHQSTADLLVTLLEVPIEVNRMSFKQTVDDLALIFKLKERAPEGKILSRKEIEKIGYEFGLLRKF